MTNPPEFTLTKNERRNRGDLVNDKTDRVMKSFDTKAEATKGGALQGAVGTEGGSVKLQQEKARFQEERTYPRSADPKSSKG